VKISYDEEIQVSSRAAQETRPKTLKHGGTEVTEVSKLRTQPVLFFSQSPFLR